MTLSDSYNDPLAGNDTLGSSVNLNSLYCSHLWTNSYVRNAILRVPNRDNHAITYCYTCKGKIRKYELRSPKNFTPPNFSTPNKLMTIETEETGMRELRDCPIDNDPHKKMSSYQRSSTDCDVTNVESKQYIPSISHQIDTSFRQKYTSYDINLNDTGRRRLRNSFKGLRCMVSFASTESPVKKRTQIQACSISVMILAIVVISFLLVNFTNPSVKGTSNLVSSTVVPTKYPNINVTASAIKKLYDIDTTITVKAEEEYLTTSTEFPSTIYQVTTQLSTERSSSVLNIISKIRKNIRTYPKNEVNKENAKPKDNTARDLSQRFCSCQNNEICMLDENSGTSVCKKPIDVDDPTGCGGLCALETEACQLVDRARGVRVCRLLTLVTCAPDEWRCRNGLCVPMEARCDGSVQCYDRSDEMYCECDLTKQFRCGHSISCFSHTKLCDGIIDCWDGYDELNCTTECPDNQFTCTDGQCILGSRFCDGLADCADSSDEPDGCRGDCGTHEIRCGNQRCVSRAVRCDGHDNCGDATDELHCL